MDNDPESVIGASSADATNIRADHSVVNQLRIVLPVSAYVIAVFCAVAFIVSGLALYEADQNHKAAWLNSYDIQQLKIGPVSYLEAEQKTTQDLVQAYGIGKTCKGAHHGR